ncbi:hypothetical protein JTB14_033124 [Gonioctena quinquepunctata]|nr:hypothetical protein JTB14_033124 [Gonioctena quinquepunctata]
MGKKKGKGRSQEASSSGQSQPVLAQQQPVQATPQVPQKAPQQTPQQTHQQAPQTPQQEAPSQGGKSKKKGGKGQQAKQQQASPSEQGPPLAETSAPSPQQKSAWGQPKKSLPDGDGSHIGVQEQVSQQQAAQTGQIFYQPTSPPPQQGPRGPPQQQVWRGGPTPQQGSRDPPQPQGPRGPPPQQVWRGSPPQQDPRGPSHPQGPKGPPQQQGLPQQQVWRGVHNREVHLNKVQEDHLNEVQEDHLNKVQEAHLNKVQEDHFDKLQEDHLNKARRTTPARPQQGPSGDPRASRVSPPTQQTATLQVVDLEPMKFVKHEPGVSGRKIRVETNHLQLKLGNLQSAIHYDVNLVPDTPKKYLRIVIDLFRVKHFPQRFPAFDGRRNLYSTNRLPFGDFISDEIVLQEPNGREKSYKVEIKFANVVDLRPLQNIELSRETPREALQVVDIVLRSAPAVNLISVGRSFFLEPERIIDLGEGMEMYNGFYQSAIRGWKPFLNVDVAHKAFPKNTNVADALVELLNSYFQRFTRDNLANPLDHRQCVTLEKYIKTLRVIYEIPGNSASRRTYRVVLTNRQEKKYSAWTVVNRQQ